MLSSRESSDPESISTNFLLLKVIVLLIELDFILPLAIYLDLPRIIYNSWSVFYVCVISYLLPLSREPLRSLRPVVISTYFKMFLMPDADTVLVTLLASRFGVCYYLGPTFWVLINSESVRFEFLIAFNSFLSARKRSVVLKSFCEFIGIIIYIGNKMMNLNYVKFKISK